jgi:PAS domain S-box-containing protein
MNNQDTAYSWLFALKDAAAVYQDGVVCASNDEFKTYLDSGDTGLLEWIKNNKTDPLHVVLSGPDGAHRVVHGFKSTLTKENTLITLQDGTELDLLKQAQTTNQNRFKALSNGTMEGIALLRGNEVIDVNERMVQITGFNEATELIKHGLKVFFKARDWKRLSTRMNEVFDIEIENSKGFKINIEAQLTSTEKNLENLQALVMLDVTEKKRIEHDLLQTKERFRLLVESSPIGLFLVVKNKIRYINQAAANLLGFEDEEQVYNEDISSLFSDSDRHRVLEDINAVHRGEKPPYIELSMRDVSDQSKPVGIQMGLTFYDQKPAVQITVSDLSTRVMLVREQMRASSAEESNVLLKEEIERHKNTQTQLRVAERLNGSIVESSIDMILAFDINHNLIQFNHAASVEFGWTFEDAKHLKPKQFLANEGEYLGVMSELDEKNYYVGELSGIRSSGETFQLLMSVASLRDDDGNTLGAVVVGRDITDLQIAEQELRRSEERYRDILDNATDLVFLVDKNGNFTYANPSFFRTLGYDGTSLLETNLQAIISLDKENWAKAISGTNKELVFIKQDGTPLNMLGGASLQTDPNGDLTGLRGIFLDVSEMRAYQRDAMVQSAKLESIFNSTKYLLMFTLDEALCISSTNQYMESTFSNQFNADVQKGTAIIELLTSFASGKLYNGQLRLLKQAQGGVQQQFELPLVDQAGEVVWYQVFVNPVRYDNQQEELSCIAYDITARKEIEQQIREALKEKEVLLQEVHHRVKNNLQVISSMLNLQRRFISDPLMLNILEESQNRISTMSFIHESLYQNSDFSSISFSSYLERLTNNLIHSYSKISCEVELVSCLHDVHINLKQAIPCGLIVNELVSNCLKYAFVGREHGKLTLRVEKTNNELEIEVSDDGVGLPEGFSFESNDSLGVYLVQALTEQLDGVLIVNNNSTTSALEKTTGSSFLVRFTPITD